jgi:hemolysin III
VPALRPREEKFNAIMHGNGLLASLVGVTGLLVLAARYGNAWHVVSCSVYGLSMIALYLASTVYHLMGRGRAREVLRIVDHACIYVFIAGTYTPFTLVTLGGEWGWSLFGVVWGLAVLGVGFKVFTTGRFELASTAVYVLMGWLALVAIGPVLAKFPVGCLYWIFAGGITYTVGVIFYALDSRPYLHTVWHGFVLGGSACHYVAVILYVLPAAAWM